MKQRVYSLMLKSTPSFKQTNGYAMFKLDKEARKMAFYSIKSA